MIVKKRRIIFISALVVLVIIAAVFSAGKKLKNNRSETSLVSPVIGDISLTVTTTGIVEPQNRLELKPSIGGRIEEILVVEGDKVRTGDILVWMSSSERAALIDTARSQGDEAVRYWEEVYKKTPIVSPIDGEVIVRSVEPGQTITTTEAVLVLSNRLIVSAQFDETDIGKVRSGQKAIIKLDAYPEIEIEGMVGHIAYESEIVNNVTIYDVDIIPKEIPEILRSGMSVTVEVVEAERKNVLTVPAVAIHLDGKRQFVLVKDKDGKVMERNITAGINNDKTAEVISGVTENDNIIVKGAAYLPKKKSAGTNPFMPSRR